MDPNQIDSYYHGFLTKRDVEPLLKKDGDFLIRKANWKGFSFSIIFRIANLSRTLYQSFFSGIQLCAFLAISSLNLGLILRTS